MPDEIPVITPEAMTTFYYSLGRALWSVGALEYYLAYYLVIVLRSSFDTMDAAEKELDRAFSFTLGNLLREFRKHRDLAPDLDRRFAAFKAERDWLCHRMYRQNQSDLLNRNRFELVLRRLATFKQEASALHEILDRSFDKWSEANGITQEELQKGIRRTIEGWRED